MKIVILLARILLGAIFLVFGLNGFLHFIPMQTLPGLAGQFLTVVIESHLYLFVFALQVIGGLLLLIDRYIPLALVLLGPIIVNIVLFHALMAPSGLPLAGLVVILWALLAFRCRTYFRGLFVQRIDV